MKRANSAALLILSLAACAAAIAAPKPPPPKQDEAPKQTQVQIVGTDQAPVVVAVDEAQRAEAKKQRDDDEAKRLKERKEDQKERLDERQEKSSSDDKLVWLTGILAAISGIQAIVFYKQWKAFRDTVEEMKLGTTATEGLGSKTQTLAAAANKQADAILKSERAYVYARVTCDGDLLLDRYENERQIKISFRNLGKTPAEITSLKITTRFHTASEQRKCENGSIFAGLDEARMPPGWAIAAGESDDRAFEVSFGADQKKMVNGKAVNLEDQIRFYVVGEISYRDTFGEPHTTAFSWFYIPWGDDKRFVPDPESQINKCI